MPVLTNPRHEIFAQHYALNGHVRLAGQEVGVRTSAEASAMLRRTGVQDRVNEIIDQRFHKANITADRVVKELARIAFADIRDLYDDDGKLLPVHLLPDDIAAVVSQIKVEIDGSGGKDGGEQRNFTISKQIKLAGKMEALGLLARHFKIVGDVDDGVNSLVSALADRLGAARRRDNTMAAEAKIVDPQALPQIDPDDPSQVLNPTATPRGMRLEYAVPDDPSNGDDVSAPRLIVPRRDPNALHSTIPQPTAEPQGADDEDFR